MNAARAVLCDFLLGADPTLAQTDDFQNPTHKDIHRAMLAHGPGYDLVSLSPMLGPDGPNEMSACLEYASTVANVKHHVAALKRERQMSDLRRGTLALMGQLDAGATTEEVGAAIERLRERSKTTATRLPRHVSETIGQYLLAGPDNPVPLGLQALSELLVVPSELCVPAARPGGGKTAFLVHVALAAARAGWQVVFFSLEMPARQIHARLVSAISGLTLSASLAKRPEDTEAIKAAIEEIWRMSLWVEDGECEGLSLDLESMGGLVSLFSEVNQDRPTVVLVDYLQRIVTKARYEKRYEILGHVCRTLKDIAKRSRVPVIAAAQLGRGVEQRGKKARPQMSDLRESGNIEADADEVVLMHRDPARDGRMLMNVAKYRQGPTFVAEVTFDAARCRFTEYVPPPSEWA